MRPGKFQPYQEVVCLIQGRMDERPVVAVSVGQHEGWFRMHDLLSFTRGQGTFRNEGFVSGTYHEEEVLNVEVLCVEFLP